MQERLFFIQNLADKARAIVTPYFRSDYAVHQKADFSPVTEADKAVESALREMIEKAYPQDGIIGEEYETKPSKNGIDWVIDPIDGTRPFILGLAHFTTLIAVIQNGVPVIGCIDQPILKDRWVGVSSDFPTAAHTLYNDTESRVREVCSLDEAIICATAPGMFMTPDLDHSCSAWQKYKALKNACKMMHWGGDAMLYAALASGRADIVLEADLGAHDYAALVPVVEGAGGFISDWHGNALTLESDGHVLACATEELHKQALEVLNKH